MTEHEWMQYVGAYCNLTWDDKDEDPVDVAVLPLGDAKLVGSQRIDAIILSN